MQDLFVLSFVGLILIFSVMYAIVKKEHLTTVIRILFLGMFVSLTCLIIVEENKNPILKFFDALQVCTVNADFRQIIDNIDSQVASYLSMSL